MKASSQAEALNELANQLKLQKSKEKEYALDSEIKHWLSDFSSQQELQIAIQKVV